MDNERIERPRVTKERPFWTPGDKHGEVNLDGVLGRQDARQEVFQVNGRGRAFDL